MRERFSSSIGGGSMFSFKNMPTTSSVVSTYTTFLTSAFVINSMIREAQNVTNQIVPKRIQQIILSKLEALFFTKKNQTPPDQIMTLIIDEHSNGSFVNQLFEASEIYLRTKITPSASLRRLKVSKLPKDKSLVLTVTPGQKIMDEFEGISLTWDITNEKKDNSSSSSNTQVQKRVIELSFDSKYMEKVLNSYLSHVMETSKSMKEEDVVLKLYGQGNIGIGQQRGGWGSITLDHPSTFETLAMEPSLKSSIIQDLDRFVRRRSFYKRVGKAWKRGYLLYGPPGTGKSSLIAAMANYLHFSIYDLQLSSVHSDSELKRLFLSTSNRSILVIEDIDCGNLPSRKNQDTNESQIKATRQVTLSGLLNFIDGLWSSCGDERIIIFTTNHKERLEPALLRPGRMDMQINMSYCTPAGFRTLVSNYLGVTTHHLLPEIDELIKEIEVTPAEIAEEFMRSEDPDIALQGLTECLQRKKRGVVEDDDSDSKVGNKKKKKATDGGDENVDIKKIREY